MYYDGDIASQVASDKEHACQCRSHNRLGFDPWVGKIPWSRKWQPTPIFLPGRSHEQRSLVGYSPLGLATVQTWLKRHSTSPNSCIFHTQILIYAAAAKSLQSCPTLCDPMDGSPPGYPVPGILQARTLEWVAISFSNAWKWKWKWSRSVLSDPMDCSLPGSSVHGIFQARVLEWGAIAFSNIT